MTGLAEVLRGLAARDGVQGALLLSGEGLRLEHAGTGFEPDTVAALAATLGQYAGRLGEGANRGEFRLAVLDFARGPLLERGDGQELGGHHPRRLIVLFELAANQEHGIGFDQ